MQSQLVPSCMYRINAEEWAVRTFKNHFIATLCTVDPNYHFYLWDCLLPQFTMTLNMLQQPRINPEVLAYK